LIATAAKEYTPSLEEGPSAESKTTPIDVSSCVNVYALYNSAVVLDEMHCVHQPVKAIWQHHCIFFYK
jgi:hypothetical protein